MEPNAFTGFLVFIVLVVVYFLPSIIASRRKHKNTNAIFIVNIFLGWTFVGWVAALVWAVAN